MPRYITLGNATIDHVITADGRDMPMQFGGDCIYAAMGIRLWCLDVGIVTIVGADYPQGWIESLSAAGMDVGGIKHISRPHRMSGAMVYDEHGSRHAGLSKPLPSQLSPEEAAAQKLASWYELSPQASDIPEAYFSSKGAHLAPMPVERQADTLTALHGRVGVITLDPPWWLEDQRPGQFADLTLLNAVLPSEAEIEGHLGHVTPEEGAQELAQEGARLVVVKLGAQGSLVYDAAKQSCSHVGVYPSAVVDPTGAGDAFCGGFLVGLDETGDPWQAALYGTVSSSFIIEGFGAQYSLQFTRADAQQRLDYLRSQVHHWR